MKSFKEHLTEKKELPYAIIQYGSKMDKKDILWIRTKFGKFSAKYIGNDNNWRDYQWQGYAENFHMSYDSLLKKLVNESIPPKVMTREEFEEFALLHIY